MTARKVPVVAQWALHGKAHDAEGYRILSCSTGELGKSHFSDALSRFTMGGADSQPQVAVSYLKHGTEAGVTYLALAVTWYADTAQHHGNTAHRYGDALAARDMNGRETTFTSYFCTPYTPLAQAGVTYWDLYEAFSAITLPTTDGPPREVTVTASAARNPAVEDLAMRAAALLLTGAPVCVLGAESTRMEERLRFIDTVMDLLPYGFRARMTAATWTKATNKNHKFKLFFSTAPRLGPQPDHVVTWDAPDQGAIPAGPPADYYESLSEKLNPISRLRTLTSESRFGPREAVQACELLDTGRFRLWRPQPQPVKQAKPVEQAQPVKQAKPGQPKSAQSTAGQATAGQATAGLAQATRPTRVAPEPDPIDLALAACAAKIRDGNPSGLRTDIRWLENQAKSTALDDARRQQYRGLVGKYKLLAPHPELKKLEGELYAALLGLAFGKPLGYESYCRIEESLAADRGTRLHTALLDAMYEVGLADQVITAIVLAHLDAVELHAWLKAGPVDIVTMINLLGRPWDHAAHAQLFCDVTLIYLKQYSGQYDRAEVRRVLRQRGFLARTLYDRHPLKEQYQYYALYGFLTAAYPTGLDAEAVIQILTGGNNPPPTPALYAAVLQLTDRADLEVAWRAYAYGSAALLGVDSDTSKQLMARVPNIELREIDPDPYLGFGGLGGLGRGAGNRSFD